MITDQGLIILDPIENKFRNLCVSEWEKLSITAVSENLPVQKTEISFKNSGQKMLIYLQSIGEKRSSATKFGQKPSFLKIKK